MNQDNYLNYERLKQFYENLKTVFVSKAEIKNRDSADNTITFESNDTVSPSAWTNVAVLKSGETHKSLAQKVSNMFKNMRYLWRLYGNTDISGLGDGTITGALGAINGNLSELGTDTVNIRETANRAVQQLMLRGLADDLLISRQISDTYTINSLLSEHMVTFFTNWTDAANFPGQFGSGVLIPALDANNKFIIYHTISHAYYGFWSSQGGLVWKKIAGDSQNGDVFVPTDRAPLEPSAPASGHLEFNDITALSNCKSFMGSATWQNVWNNIISTRHRNGCSDGNSFGMYLRSTLTEKSDLLWGQQVNSDTWIPERTLLDSDNYNNYRMHFGTPSTNVFDRPATAGLCIRENNLVQNTMGTDMAYAPSIGFLWGGYTAGVLAMDANGHYCFFTHNGSQATIEASVVTQENLGIQWWNDEGPLIGAFPGNMIFAPNGWSTVETLEDIVEITCNSTMHYFGARTDNHYSLGRSNRRWKQIFAATSTISTSDESLKDNINKLDDELTMQFILGQEPVSYVLKDGDSGRTHYGLIAQKVEKLMDELGMTSMDFAGFIKSPMIKTEDIEVEDKNGNKHFEQTEKTIDGEYRYGLRYEEFISPVIKMEQILYDLYMCQNKRINEQEEIIQKLTARLEAVEQHLAPV